MMRDDGATMADGAAVLIASDEGPQDQTWECLERVVDMEIPTIIAISKSDLASTCSVRRQLRESGYEERPGLRIVELSAGDRSGGSDDSNNNNGIADFVNAVVDLMKEALLPPPASQLFYF